VIERPRTDEPYLASIELGDEDDGTFTIVETLEDGKQTKYLGLDERSAMARVWAWVEARRRRRSSG
jgi:hypothetical protein